MSLISMTKIATAMLSGAWAAGSVATNPSATDVLVTTGQLAAGDWLFSANMHSEAATTLQIAHRNAANSADLKAYDIPVPADTEIPIIIPIKIPMAKNERIVIRCKANVTGDVQASIFYSQVVG